MMHGNSTYGLLIDILRIQAVFFWLKYLNCPAFTAQVDSKLVCAYKLAVSESKTQGELILVKYMVHEYKLVNLSRPFRVIVYCSRKAASLKAFTVPVRKSRTTS